MSIKRKRRRKPSRGSVLRSYPLGPRLSRGTGQNAKHPRPRRRESPRTGLMSGGHRKGARERRRPQASSSARRRAENVTTSHFKFVGKPVATPTTISDEARMLDTWSNNPVGAGRTSSAGPPAPRPGSARNRNSHRSEASASHNLSSPQHTRRPGNLGGRGPADPRRSLRDRRHTIASEPPRIDSISDGPYTATVCRKRNFFSLCPNRHPILMPSLATKSDQSYWRQSEHFHPCEVCLHRQSASSKRAKWRIVGHTSSSQRDRR